MLEPATDSWASNCRPDAGITAMKTIPLSALGPLAQELFCHFSDVSRSLFPCAVESAAGFTVSRLWTPSEAQSLLAYLNSNDNIGYTHRNP